jgi:hypothetical protein
VAVSIRRSPQPFQGFVFLLAAAAAGWLGVGIILGGDAVDVAMALFGSALLLTGASLVLNVNHCADYMKDAIRKDAPYGFDFFRYALAEGRSGARLPGVLVAVIGLAVVGYAIAVLVR